MTTPPDLPASLLSPGAGASFIATRHGGLVRIEPLTHAAQAWLQANVGEEPSWDGETLVVEMRYFPPIADAAIAAGHSFERDAKPN